MADDMKAKERRNKVRAVAALQKLASRPTLPQEFRDHVFRRLNEVTTGDTEISADDLYECITSTLFTGDDLSRASARRTKRERNAERNDKIIAAWREETARGVLDTKADQVVAKQFGLSASEIYRIRDALKVR